MARRYSLLDLEPSRNAKMSKRPSDWFGFFSVSGLMILLIGVGLQEKAALFFLVMVVCPVVSCVVLAVLLSAKRDFRSERLLIGILLLIGLQFGVLLGEVVLRSVDYWYRRQMSDRERFIVEQYLPAWRSPEVAGRLHQSDPRMKKLLRPNTRTRFLDCPISINSQGTRGREFPTEKQPGELRILCLGSSTTFGATIKATDRPYPEVLEEILAKRLDRPVTVINGGISGTQMKVSANRLKYRLIDFHPDIVVLYHGFNDIPSGIQGGFRFRPKGSLFLERTIRLVANSVDQTSGIEYDGSTFRKGLEEIVAICRSSQMELYLCTFAMAFDENTPARLMTFYRRIMPLYGKVQIFSSLENVRLNNRIVCEVAAVHGLPIVDIAAELEGRSEYFLDFCHFEQAGRDLLAMQVAQAIQKTSRSVTSASVPAQEALSAAVPEASTAAPIVNQGDAERSLE